MLLMKRAGHGDVSPDNYALVLAIALHVCVAVVSDGKYVWGKLSNLSVLVEFDLFRCVDG